MLGELCRACRLATVTGPCSATGPVTIVCGASGPLHIGVGGGFVLHEALWLRVAGVSEPHVVQFPRVVSGVARVLAEVLAAGPIDWQC